MEAFPVGALLGDVFFHSIPHLIEEKIHDESISIGDNLMNSFFIMILGILGCYFIEVVCNKYLHSHSHSHHHHHHHEEVKEVNGKKNTKSNSDEKKEVLVEKHSHINNAHTGHFVSLFGDFAHNITDGILLAITFQQKLSFGFATTLAIFIHEIPHEIGDFALGFKSGFSFFKIIFFQLITAMGAFFGTFIGLKFGD